MTIEYSDEFHKQYQKAPPKIQNAVDKRTALFTKDPFHPLLNNHLLKGQYQGKRSINITGDWRAIFREVGNYQFVIFEILGTHSQLYK